jgi:hypothetical protein
LLNDQGAVCPLTGVHGAWTRVQGWVDGALVLGVLFFIITLVRMSNNEFKNDQVISSSIIIFVLFALTYFFLFYKSKEVQNKNTILSNKTHSSTKKLKLNKIYPLNMAYLDKLIILF